MNKQPSQIGHYTIERELGRGGMSVVYLATDTQELRRVALKVLPLHLNQDNAYLERFQREGISTQSLRHPNIIKVYAAGEADDYYYIAMEYMPNGTLADRIRQQGGPLPEMEVITILQQVAAGLDYAHDQEYLHRDIKPSNILFAEDGRAVIADFGVAKDLSTNASNLTIAGMAVGTPAFMSPEQARGDTAIDSRADIYSLGVVVYNMLTGKMPFEADSELALLRKIIDETPLPPERFNPRIHPSAAYVLKLVLAKDPETRYATAGLFFATLRYQLMMPPVNIQPVKPVIPPPSLQTPPPVNKTPTPPPDKKTPTPISNFGMSGQKVDALPDSSELAPQLTSSRVSTWITSAVFVVAAIGLVFLIWQVSLPGSDGGSAGPPTPPQLTSVPRGTLPVPVATETQTVTPSGTPSPTDTATATAAPTDTPLPPTATFTPVVTEGPLPPAQVTPTPMPTSTATRRPTSTPLATRTPTRTPTRMPTPRATPTPTSGSAATPTPGVVTVPSYQFYLIDPGDNANINYAEETFAWYTDHPLAANQGLELVFWPKSLGADKWNEGRSPVGARTSNPGNYWQADVDLVGFEADQPQFFRPNNDYYWGVVLVNTAPSYEKIRLLGEVRLFTYRR